MTSDGRQRWEAAYAAALARGQVRDADFTPLSGGGEYPFPRGLYPSGYRGRAWTIRQFAGFGNARQTNQRYKMILEAGGGGLSVAFDMPTLMGRDSDEPLSLGEAGHCGAATDPAP